MKKVFVSTMMAVILLAPTTVSAEASVQTNGESVDQTFWDSSEVDYLKQMETSYRNNHPDATEDEIETYVKSLIHSAVETGRDDTNQGLYTYLLDADLSDVEQELYDENPSVGDDVLYEGYVAKNAAESSGLDGAHNGKQDAFRHAYWNALMLDEVGRTWAERWGTAHEDGATSQPQIERTMDLTNNERGRQAAEEVIAVNQVVTDSELKDEVMAYLNLGKLVYIKDGSLVASNH